MRTLPSPSNKPAAHASSTSLIPMSPSSPLRSLGTACVMVGVNVHDAGELWLCAAIKVAAATRQHDTLLRLRVENHVLAGRRAPDEHDFGGAASAGGHRSTLPVVEQQRLAGTLHLVKPLRGAALVRVRRLERRRDSEPGGV